MKEKCCNVCNQIKNVSEFYVKRINSKGVRYLCCCKECCTKNYHENKHRFIDKRKAASKIYLEKNKITIREKNRNWRTKKRREMINFLGGSCVSCGFSDDRALQVDHVLGGGTKDRHENNLNPVNQLFQDVINNPEKYQLLCANCNWIKRVENKEYPHAI